MEFISSIKRNQVAWNNIIWRITFASWFPRDTFETTTITTNDWRPIVPCNEFNIHREQRTDAVTNWKWPGLESLGDRLKRLEHVHLHSHAPDACPMDITITDKHYRKTKLKRTTGEEASVARIFLRRRDNYGNTIRHEIGTYLRYSAGFYEFPPPYGHVYTKRAIGI